MPYPVVAPLIMWSVVAAVCALALVVEAIILFGRLRSAPKRREWRWFSLGLLAGSVVGIVLAQQAYAAYRHFTPLGGCRRLPAEDCAAYYAQRAQAISVFTALGWILVVLTVALLFAGAVLLVRASRRG
jgi:hypothetical protein